MTANPSTLRQHDIERGMAMLKLLPAYKRAEAEKQARDARRNFTGPQESWSQSVEIYVNRWSDGRPESPQDAQDADYTQLLEDIQVEVPIYDIYNGSGDVDDPSEATASELGRVIEDVPALNAEGLDIPGEFLFKAGEWIALTAKEKNEAEDDFWQGVSDARKNYEPADDDF